MSKQNWPTGPAESIRTREFAEAEWSRLVSSSARDKNSFLTELKEINDRIIGLKQSLPPLNIPQTVSYQEKPKDYGFVVDSNMRVASAISLSNAKGLRENLSRMLVQQVPQSASYRPGESGLTRNETKRTDFDILTSARQAEPDTRNVYIHQEPPLRAVDGYFVPSSERRHESEESDEARKDAQFARALEAYAYRSSRPPAPEEPQPVSEKRSSAVLPVVERHENVEPEARDEKEEGDEELEEDASEDDDENNRDEGEEGGGDDDETEPKEDVELTQPVVVHGHGATSSAPAATTGAAPARLAPAVIAPASVPAPRQPAAASSTNIVPTAASALQTVFSPQVQAPAPASVPTSMKPSAEEPRCAPISAEPADDSSEQLSRLQAWEKELQEREQKVLQYMNSLSRPIGAKMAPKQLHDDPEPEQDVFEQRYGSRRRDGGQSALRGSADIHIHNHIAPPITMPAYAPQPAPVPRSSLYDSYQRSTFTPSKYEYTPAVEATREFVTPNVQPSIQTRYPQRSEIRSNYAFPPAPYSSLNSGASNVDLSGLSLERMRELTGHY